jgi:hypothetical protein
MTASSIPLGGVNRTVEIVKRWLLSKGRSHSCFGYRCGGPGWAAIPDSPTRKYSDFRIDASDRGRVQRFRNYRGHQERTGDGLSSFCSIYGVCGNGPIFRQLCSHNVAAFRTFGVAEYSDVRRIWELFAFLPWVSYCRQHTSGKD